MTDHCNFRVIFRHFRGFIVWSSITFISYILQQSRSQLHNLLPIANFFLQNNIFQIFFRLLLRTLSAVVCITLDCKVVTMVTWLSSKIILFSSKIRGHHWQLQTLPISTPLLWYLLFTWSSVSCSQIINQLDFCIIFMWKAVFTSSISCQTK